jgi:hypothetical protein
VVSVTDPYGRILGFLLLEAELTPGPSAAGKIMSIEVIHS